MKPSEFRRRMKALGYFNPNAAAAALRADRSSVYRMWHGKRPIQPRTVRMLELLEAAQPAPMTPLVQRLLLTSSGEVGSQVTPPEPRSRFDVPDWDSVQRQAKENGLLVSWGRAYVLTELGAACFRFLARTQGATV